MYFMAQELAFDGRVRDWEHGSHDGWRWWVHNDSSGTDPIAQDELEIRARRNSNLRLVGFPVDGLSRLLGTLL